MAVGTFVSRRLLGLAVTIFASVTAVFFVVRLLPGDPAAIMAGEDATPELIRAARAEGLP